jgi:hypothetical protein
MDNLAQIHEGLQNAGYVAKHDLENDVVIISLDGGIPAVLMVENNQLSITAQICTLGELQEDNLLTFAMAALDANSRISPFAFSLITERDDPSITEPSEYAVTLVDHIPLGDFEQPELESAMQSLLTALVGSREAIQAGCEEPVAETAPAA